MISEYMNLLGQEGEGFKSIVYDKNRIEINPVTNIKEINKGAWHKQWMLRLASEWNLNTATRMLLDVWEIDTSLRNLYLNYGYLNHKYLGE
jgi:hypothetical protein